MTPIPDATRARMQREAAAVAGLDPALAGQIRGETQQGMIEHADALYAAQQQAAAAAAQAQELQYWRSACAARYRIAPSVPLTGETPAAIETAARAWVRALRPDLRLPPPLRPEVPVDDTPVARYTPPPAVPAWEPPPDPRQARPAAAPTLVPWNDAGPGPGA